MKLSQQVRRIDFIETAGELGALLLEARLVKELVPIHNRQLRQTRDLFAIRLKPGRDGTSQAVVIQRNPFNDGLTYVNQCAIPNQGEPSCRLRLVVPDRINRAKTLANPFDYTPREFRAYGSLSPCQAIEKGLEKDAQLEDADAAKVVKSQIKQLKDAMADFEKAGRDDLASQNKKEIGFLSEYLPEEMGEDELRKIVKQKINEFGEPTAQDFGKVLGAVMKEVGDRADGAMVKRLVQELLAS